MTAPAPRLYWVDGELRDSVGYDAWAAARRVARLEESAGRWLTAITRYPSTQSRQEQAHYRATSARLYRRSRILMGAWCASGEYPPPGWPELVQTRAL